MSFDQVEYVTISNQDIFDIETRDRLQQIGFTEDKHGFYFDPGHKLYILLQFTNKKPKSYITLYHIVSDDNSIHLRLKKLLNGKIQCINEHNSTKIIINNKDYIELYEAMYGKGSFEKNFIKEYLTKFRDGKCKGYDSPQQLLTKFR